MKLLGLSTHKSVLLFVFALMFAALVAFSASGSSAASKVKQKTFASPEEAVKALIDAIKTDNKTELSVIFGPGSSSQLSSGDDVSDRAERERFLKAYEEKNCLEKKDNDKAILLVGNDDWPLPIPIVKKGSTWYFDTKAGKEEILNRRIGGNELRVIEVMQVYVGAQREYAGKDRDGDGIYAYAQKFASTPGKKDGLYWEAKEGEGESPSGPFVAKAAQEGYTRKAKTDKPSPFHGYYFRILTAQGKHAPGGAYDYIVKGNMTLGFGLIAYPAKYGYSGIMTFIVNQEGVVYQKDLGKNTTRVATTIKNYDPDKTWKKVAETAGK
ncbi:MAG: DUF2950 domain-containing protein [Nitrospirae bacterium]|nr:DUF2950 domain-containing protein [Nitrospirota bacterium]